MRESEAAPQLFEVRSADTAYRMVLPDAATDYIQGKIATSGEPYEESMLHDMARRVTADDLVLDMGANIGNHTLFLASVTGCRVVAYEPNPRLAAPLRASIEANELGDRVTVREVAVGDEPGHGAFDVEMPDNLGGQSVAVDAQGALEIVRLDDEELPQPPSVLKIDVEGMEVPALLGAEKTIAEHRPVLYVECRDREAFLEVHEWAVDHQYVLCDEFNATPTFRLEPAERVSGMAALQRSLARTLEERYELRQNLRSTKSLLLDANTKYRALGESYQKLKDQRESSGAPTGSVSEALDRLEAALERAITAETELKTVRAQLDAANTKYRQVTETQATARAELADARQSGKELQAEIELLTRAHERLEKRYRRTRARAAKYKRRVRQIRSSTTFQTGLAVKRATTSWRDAVKLPVRVFRLSKRRRRTAAALPSAKARPALEVKPVRRTVLTREAARSRVRTPRVLAPGEKLRVATIMDEFTRLSFAAEWNLTDLTPDDWFDQLEQAEPDLLFVESAWRGSNGTWHNTVPLAGTEMRGIVDWCRERGVPTVFWNKEDPVHYATFLNVASLFGHVFTTDMDRIEHYKADLGHDHVSLLPFAAQPSKDHPIETGDRKDAFMFAGAYYRRYPDRTRDLEDFVEHLPSLRPVEIYDRNFGGTDEAYMFPDEYRPMIVGTLAPEDMAIAYKGYRYAINLNSVQQSQTMLARRAFELVASNTLTVSNFSRAARLLFGDLVVTAGSGREVVRRLQHLAEQDAEDELRLQALRTVMSQHTYADRADYVWARANGDVWEQWAPMVHVIGIARDADDYHRIVANLLGQAHRTWRATIVVDTTPETPVDDPRITLVPSNDLRGSLRALAEDAEVIASMWGGDYYGPHYLMDLVLGLRYSDATVLGKHRHHRWADDRTELTEGVEYRSVAKLSPRRSVVRTAAIAGTSVAEWARTIRADASLPFRDQLALDRFGYCADVPHGCDVSSVDDRPMTGGASMVDLLALAEGIPAAKHSHVGHRTGPAELATLFAGAARPGVTLAPAVDGLYVISTLADDKHEYVHATMNIPADPAWKVSGAVHVQVGTGLDLQVAFFFLDDDGTRLASPVVRNHTNLTLDVPSGTTQVRLAIRARGTGTGAVRAVVWEHLETEPSVVLAPSLVRAPASGSNQSQTLRGSTLARLFDGAAEEHVSAHMEGGGLVVRSTLPSSTRSYLTSMTSISVRPGWASSGAVHVRADAEMDLQLALYFFDNAGNRLTSPLVRCNEDAKVEVPAGAAHIRLALRVKGPGTAHVRSVRLGRHEESPRALVVSNLYPSYGDLYRNAFVHSRVTAYREVGVPVDVFCLHDDSAIGYREFEDVDVTTGSDTAFTALLAQGDYDSILVHFLTPSMWSALSQRRPGTRVVVWVHGAEIQPWWRRAFNYTDDDQIEIAKAQSTERLAFWTDVLRNAGDDVHFVFVSQFLADVAMEDTGVTLASSQYSIIHNPIDVDRFAYRSKDPALRHQVLSIRPYASRTYANDLAVEAVLRLSLEPEFDDLRFRFVGDGPLFEETLRPIADLPNVLVEKRFLTRDEIAAMHREHGVFLVPSRMDSQGVSRDEAMASGLVPVTSAVAAIPEFVTEETAFLAASEDSDGLAEGILALVRDPALFQRMSAAAAAHVRSLSAAEDVAQAELVTAGLRPRTRRSFEPPLNVLVYGSCVTRDAFEIADPMQVRVHDYVARSSMSTALTDRPVTGVDVDTLASAFQRRIVTRDLTKQLREIVAGSAWDLLVHDPIDERFHVLVGPDGELATRSNELVATGWEDPRYRQVNSGSDEHFRMWEAGWAQLVALLDSIGRLDDLRVNRVAWALVDDRGQSLTDGALVQAQRANAYLERLYARMADDIRADQFYTYSRQHLVSASDHKWGPSPFHFGEQLYVRTVEHMVAELGPVES